MSAESLDFRQTSKTAEKFTDKSESKSEKSKDSKETKENSRAGRRKFEALGRTAEQAAEKREAQSSSSTRLERHIFSLIDKKEGKAGSFQSEKSERQGTITKTAEADKEPSTTEKDNVENEHPTTKPELHLVETSAENDEAKLADNEDPEVINPSEQKPVLRLVARAELATLPPAEDLEKQQTAEAAIDLSVRDALEHMVESGEVEASGDTIAKLEATPAEKAAAETAIVAGAVSAGEAETDNTLSEEPIETVEHEFNEDGGEISLQPEQTTAVEPEHTESLEEDEPTQPVTATTPTPTGTAGGGGPTGTGGTGGGGHGGHGGHFGGPFGPAGPGGPGGPGGPFGFGGPGGPGGHNFNAMPAAAAANTADAAPRMEYIDDRANPAAMALFGGIIGYLIGRRRGRIKTEKRLLPIQKKLEKQVEDLQWQVRDQTAKVRRVAAEKVKQQGAVTVIETLVAKRQVERSIAKTAEQPLAARDKGSSEVRLEAQGTTPPAPERIGQVLVGTEMPNRIDRSISERQKLSVEALQKSSLHSAEKLKQLHPEVMPEVEKHVETMNRNELLELSEKIVVDGTSLRQIYETHLIGERGLRRLVAEHLRGGEVKKALKQEIIEHEIDFERDPAMRDVAAYKPGGGGGATSGKAALNKLLENVVVPAEAGEQAAYYKAMARYEANQFAQAQKQRRLVDISMGMVILFLLGLVIIMFITHS